MAVRARLSAPPPPPPQEWPFHVVKWAALRARVLTEADNRLAARTFLSTGYGIRLAIESRPHGWTRFDSIAEIVQPPRTKGTIVSRDHGTPFLIANQMFEPRPRPRKWLALGKIKHGDQLFAAEGTIVVRRSADVGRSTITCKFHEGHLISDHFFRVEPRKPRDKGWLYAFIRSPQGRAMMTGSQYGHIIQHIEFGHLRELPIPAVSDAVASDFNQRVSRIVQYRNEAFRLSEEADDRFARAVGSIEPDATDEGFVVRATDAFRGRRRLEASHYAPAVIAILKRFKRFNRLRDVTTRVWWMTRLKRFYGDGGLPYLSAEELFSVNPAATKRILVDPKDNHREYFVKAGWIVMACSGQVYGLNGAAALMTERHEETFMSHDLIRIVPDTSKIRAGYLVVALTHRTLGRPLLIRAAYGTSIPHLDPEDVAEFPVVRVGDKEEAAISDLAEAAAKARAEADAIERQIAAEAGLIVDQFIAGRLSFPVARTV